MKTCPPELLAAVSMAERLAELVEAGRQDDAYNEFFGRPFSDRYSAAHKAILAAYNEHVGETLGDHLEGLLASLMRLKQPHPKGPVNPVGIRSYCEDIRRHFEGANAMPRGTHQQAETGGSGPWSRPNTPSEWARMFGCSRATFQRRVKDGTIRAKKLSCRSYQVHLNDVPSKHK